MSAEGKKDGPKATPENVKSEPRTPNQGGFQRGGRGGVFRGGNRGGRGGFNGQQGAAGPQANSEASSSGPQRGGGRGGMGGNQNRQQRGGGGGGGGGGQGGQQGGRFEQGGGRFDRVAERLQTIQGPTFDLPSIDTSGAKFSGRSRLYIGNLPADTTEESLKQLLSPFGEVGEIFHNKEKKFGFLRMGTRYEAEKAKRGLDGLNKNGQILKVRFAPHQAAVKVLNLGPWVSNELLHRAFSIYGEIERAIVFVDDRGRSKGEGIVEFERKPSALEAVKRCSTGCYFLTASIRPVIAELDEETEDDDGLQEKLMQKRNQEYHSEREVGPRFAEPSSFEFEYGAKWKALYEMKKQKLLALDREMKLEEDKLVAQMEFARYEHETEHLRAQLREREASRDQKKNLWEARERETQEMIKLEQERRQREEEAMSSRMQQQDASMRQRQQENSLFMQAQELTSMLDQQEAEMQGRPRPGFGGPNFGGPSQGPLGGGRFNNQGNNFRGGPQNEVKPLLQNAPGFGGPGFNNPNMGGPGPSGNFGGPGIFNNAPGGRGGRGRRWDNGDGGDDLQMKRRRF